ncbi:MAG: hypothetical protein H6707_03430 [Deltaproteobacteria bacterium]|nr:hypothetical protein [Deltaproteobacteria bacterium]
MLAQSRSTDQLSNDAIRNERVDRLTSALARGELETIYLHLTEARICGRGGTLGDGADPDLNADLEQALIRCQATWQAKRDEAQLLRALLDELPDYRAPADPRTAFDPEQLDSGVPSGISALDQPRARLHLERAIALFQPPSEIREALSQLLALFPNTATYWCSNEPLTDALSDVGLFVVWPPHAMLLVYVVDAP